MRKSSLNLCRKNVATRLGHTLAAPQARGVLRLRITRPLSGSVDGIQLARFEMGKVYDFGTELANYLMAIRAAEPVEDEHPATIVPLHQPDLLNEIRRRARESAKMIAVAADGPAPRGKRGRRPEPSR